MAVNYIYKLCKSCNGDGTLDIYIYPGEGEPPDSGHWNEITCTVCNGVGKLLWGELHDELIGEE